MIGYMTLGTNDIQKAGAFYDALLAELGGKRAFNLDRLITWSNGAAGMLGVAKPYDGKPATVGNGVMPALAAPSRAVVDKVYAKAISLGASDEGKPGIRGGEGSNFYGAYFRDLDGNKLAVFCMAPA